eukprot:Gregarina_sp_Poly_1__553@NODE_1132_length_4988_cov_108_528145_g782_i0_p1_GENE_NODE_1132_length_4988_cov_108_528145_g782_i0NODE_1132_length_4988_cov_108_528145_g782_i0_p1_ORF_typecomplete_len637_score84_17CRM1_C/PF08767_11/2e02CRM1_C/PF08767_11/0_058_NODE_1132_length_4988_cov_108_528145_g782_i015723482
MIDSYTRAQTVFLECLKRCYLLELLTLEWIEEFWRHVSMSLSPTQYLQWRRKLKLLVDVWAGGIESTSIASRQTENTMAIESNATREISIRLPYGRYQAPTGTSVSSLIPLWMIKNLHMGSQERLMSLDVEGFLRITAIENDQTSNLPQYNLAQVLEQDEQKELMASEEDAKKKPPAALVDDLLLSKPVTSKVTCTTLQLTDLICANIAEDDLLENPKSHKVSPPTELPDPQQLWSPIDNKALSQLWSLLSARHFQTLIGLFELPLIQSHERLIRSTLQMALYFGDFQNFLSACFRHTYKRLFYTAQSSRPFQRNLDKLLILVTRCIVRTSLRDAHGREHAPGFLSSKDFNEFMFTISGMVNRLVWDHTPIEDHAANQDQNEPPIQNFDEELVTSVVAQCLDNIVQIGFHHLPQFFQTLIYAAKHTLPQAVTECFEVTPDVVSPSVAVALCALLFLSHVMAPLSRLVAHSPTAKSAAKAISKKLLLMGFDSWMRAFMLDDRAPPSAATLVEQSSLNIATWIRYTLMAEMPAGSPPALELVDGPRALWASEGALAWACTLSELHCAVGAGVERDLLPYHWTKSQSTQFLDTLESLWEVSEGIKRKFESGSNAIAPSTLGAELADKTLTPLNLQIDTR